MGIPRDNAATMEIEFKFCIPPDRLAAVQAAVRRGRCVAIRMEARYFDTPDGALASRGIAFSPAARRRPVGANRQGAGRWPAGPAGAQRRTRPRHRRHRARAPAPVAQWHRGGRPAAAGPASRWWPPRRNLWHRDGPADTRYHPPGSGGRAGVGHRPGGGPAGHAPAGRGPHLRAGAGTQGRAGDGPGSARRAVGHAARAVSEHRVQGRTGRAPAGTSWQSVWHFHSI